MTGAEPKADRGAPAPPPADIARYEAAAAAAADPNALMDTVTDRFRDMALLAAAGDRLAVLSAGNRVAESCLRLCAVPATSSVAADNKVRFLTIMSGWAWPRRPALAAIMDAARDAERQVWGGDVSGVA